MSQPKRSPMARLRASRKAQRLGRVEFWLSPAQAEKVREYVARIMRATSSGQSVKGKK